MDYSKIKEKYDSFKTYIPVNHIRPRFGHLRHKENEHHAAVIERWLVIMERELQPLIKVITCIPSTRWEEYEKLGLTDFPEYIKRKKLETEYRNIWNETMPLILKPKRDTQ